MSTPALPLRDHLAFLRAVWRPNRGFLLLLFGLTTVSTAVTIAYPLVFQRALDAMGTGREVLAGRLPGILLLLGAVALGRVLAGFYPSVRAWVNQRIEMAVRARVFGSILRKDPSFFSRFRTGDLVTRLTDDITDYPRIGWFACSGVFRFVDSMSRFAFCIVAMLLLDVNLTLLALLPVPVMLYVFYMARRAMGETYQAQQESVARTNDVLESAFSGIRIVKAFNAAPGQEHRLGEVLEERIRIQLRLARLNVLIHQLDEAAGRFGQVLVVLLGGLRFLDGTLTLGTLYAIYLYLDQLIHPMIDLPNLLVTAKQAFVSIDREEEVLRDPAVVERRGTREGPARIESVGLRGATLAYGGDRAPALRVDAIEMRAGERVAVVGAVGSGKTTLVRALAGLLTPSEGAVLVNGQPFDAWTWPTLRSRIGYVPQDAQLFSDTVAENVSFGREGDEVWLRRCLDVAQMTPDLATMPAEVSTRLGRGGTRVSGGQRQRIAIARALFGRPDLLLLDDCTASLDADNEDRFWSALAEAFPGVTVVVVSHRLATIRRADRVIVLEDGRPADQGTHEDLAQRSPTYQSFLQTEEIQSHLRALQATSP